MNGKKIKIKNVRDHEIYPHETHSTIKSAHLKNWTLKTNFEIKMQKLTHKYLYHLNNMKEFEVKFACITLSDGQININSYLKCSNTAHKNIITISTLYQHYINTIITLSSYFSLTLLIGQL